MYILLVFAVFPAITLGSCIGEGWMPYKSEKCYKILEDSYATHAGAMSKCKSLDSVLLSINSKEEDAFLSNYLFHESNLVDGIWIITEWVNETEEVDVSDDKSHVSGRMYKDKNGSDGRLKSETLQHPCLELRSEYNKCAAEADNPMGSWYIVPCNKRNLVVCQKMQEMSPHEMLTKLVEATDKMQNLYFQIQNFDSLIKEIKEIIEEKDKQMKVLEENLNKLAKSAITSIRLGQPESVHVWNGPGYPDIPGYVLTGLTNGNRDQNADIVYRRRFEKFANGKWLAI